MKDIFHYEKDIQVQRHQKELMQKAADWRLTKTTGQRRRISLSVMNWHRLPARLAGTLLRRGRYLLQRVTLPTAAVQSKEQRRPRQA